MKDWAIKHKRQLCIIGSVVLVVVLVCVIVFGIKGCSKVKEEPYKAPSVAESESEQSSKDSETSEQPSQETSEQSESQSSSSGGTDTPSSSSPKQPAQTPSQKPSSPATQQPSSGKTYHTAWGTRPHEFEEAFSWDVVTSLGSGMFGRYHVDLYGNCWHDWQEHSNGHGKMIFYAPAFLGPAKYCGNGHWINDSMFGYYWGEYDYPITEHGGQEVPFDPNNGTLAEHPSDMLVAGGAEIGSYYAQYGDVIGRIYELLYLYPSCQTVEELVSHSQPTYNVDGSMYTKALDVKTVNAYGLYEMTSYDKWEPKSKYIAP